jgi:hypothetical protein
MCVYTEKLAKVCMDHCHAGKGVLNSLQCGSDDLFLGDLNGNGIGNGERILFLKLCLLKYCDVLPVNTSNILWVADFVS